MKLLIGCVVALLCLQVSLLQIDFLHVFSSTSTLIPESTSWRSRSPMRRPCSLQGRSQNIFPILWSGTWRCTRRSRWNSKHLYNIDASTWNLFISQLRFEPNRRGNDLPNIAVFRKFLCDAYCSIAIYHPPSILLWCTTQYVRWF